MNAQGFFLAAFIFCASAQGALCADTLGTVTPDRKPPMPVPDSSTFFPLLEGSFWKYEAHSRGAKQEGQGETDSVVSLKECAGGYRAVVVRTYESDDIIDTLVYVTDSAGTVYNEIEGDLYPFAKLFPRAGDTLGDFHFEIFSNSYGVKRGPDMFQLVGNDPVYEEVAGDNIEWQTIFFRQGAGIFSKAATGFSYDLTGHRIGK
jgi:hypothetical protein